MSGSYTDDYCSSKDYEIKDIAKYTHLPNSTS